MRSGRPEVDAVYSGAKRAKGGRHVVLAVIVVGLVAAVVGIAGGALLRTAVDRRRRSRYYYWTTSPSRPIRSNGNVVIPNEPSGLTGHSLRSRSR